LRKTLLVVRIFFLVLCISGSWLLTFGDPSWQARQGIIVLCGTLIGALVILLDVALRGFSLRGLTAVTFGLACGSISAWIISASPLLEAGDEKMIFLVRLILFVVLTYLGTVIALRGKDNFNVVIPYVRFQPEETPQSNILVDTSCLMDGRVVKIAKAHFLTGTLIIPAFVIQELQQIADSKDRDRRRRGRRGLDNLNELKQVEGLEIRVHDSDQGRDYEAKIIFLARTLRARLMTLDLSLAKLAHFHGIIWLNIVDLSKALTPVYEVGETFSLTLVRKGKESGQAVGYLADGSMVVVNDGEPEIGNEAQVEVISVLPSSAGKMIFSKMAMRNHPETDGMDE